MNQIALASALETVCQSNSTALCKKKKKEMRGMTRHDVTCIHLPIEVFFLYS